MTSKIPATVVTGFLGAGKTSLLRHLVATSGRRLALLINEFGDLGVDRELVLGCAIAGCREDDVVELTNGCICCTVADDFLPAIERLLDRPDPPDHIIVETSGLALPKPLVRAFAWPEVRTRITVDGVVTVVDAAAVAAGRFADDPGAVETARRADPALDHDSPLAELFEDQLQSADLVILNKADLVDAAAIAAVRTAITEHLRPAVKTVAAQHGRLDSSVLLGIAAAAEDDLASRRSHHDEEGEHDHDDFASFVLSLAEVDDPAALERRLAAAIASHDILRVKGFLAVPDKPMRLALQGVGPRIERWFDRPWGAGEPRRSRLVVIGQQGLDAEAVAREIGGTVEAPPPQPTAAPLDGEGLAQRAQSGFRAAGR